MTESSQRGDYERRIKRLEDNDEKIFNSLEQIKDGQHNQSLINQKNEFHFGLYQQREGIRISKQKKKIKKISKT